MQKRSLALLNSALHTSDHFIAITKRSETIITIGRDVRLRYWLWFFLFQSRDSIGQCLALCGVLGTKCACQRTGVDVETSLDNLRCEECLTGRSLVVRFKDGALDVFWPSLERFGLQLFTV